MEGIGEDGIGVEGTGRDETGLLGGVEGMEVALSSALPLGALIHFP